MTIATITDGINLGGTIIANAPSVVALIKNIQDLATAKGLTVTITELEDQTIGIAQGELSASEKWRKENPETL